MKILHILYLVLFLLNVSAAQLFASQSIGIVKSVSGNAYLQNGEKKVPAYMHMKISLGDQISTADKSSIGLILDDDTVVSLGPNSTILLKDFLFDPAASKLSFAAKMLKGTFSFITGQIAKLAPKKVNLETPDATLGVRGTKFLVKID